MSTAPNGHVAADDLRSSETSVIERIEEHVAALDALLAPLRAERDQVKAKLDDLNAREKAIIHATAALRGGSRPRVQTQAPSRPAPKKGEWTPSEERLKSLFELMVRQPEPISPTQLAEKTEGLGVETASKGFKILRERELLRVTGALRGGGSLYTVMDGAEWPS